MWFGTGWRRPMPAPTCSNARRVLMDDWARYLDQGMGCPHQVRQGDLAQGRPGIEPHPQAHGRQGQVNWNDLGSRSPFYGLPSRDHCGESDLPFNGRAKVPPPWRATLYPSPVAHQRSKRVGSLSPPAPLSCGAPPRRAGGGHARRSLASPFRSGRGKCLSFRV